MKETLSGLIITFLVLVLRIIVALGDKAVARKTELHKLLDDAMKESDNEKKLRKIDYFFNRLNA